MKTTGRVARALALVVAVVAVLPAPVAAQDLADFDYDELALRAMGMWGGGVWPNRVEESAAIGIRADLGYAGPGLRVVPTIGYWSSTMKPSEVSELSRRVEALVDEQAPPGTPPSSVDLGTIEWSDLIFGVDAHIVWAVPFDLLTYAGMGFSAHLTDGSGPSIDDTFVEDLIDSFSAGVNLHTGVEYLVTDRLRLFVEGRYEIQADLRYPELRGGFTVHFGDIAPGEERGR